MDTPAICPECQNTRRIRVVTQDKATGKWTREKKVDCEVCKVKDDTDDDTDEHVPVVVSEGAD